MIKLSPNCFLDENELQFEFTCCSGPGGQNVNKVATAVRLRFHVASSSLPDYVKSRIFAKLAGRMNAVGELIVESRVHRTQLLNRQEVLKKLEHILCSALVKERRRVKTRPTKASVRRRLDGKKKRSQIKSNRGRVSPDS